MELYATYASKDVLIRIKEDYHYGFVGVWLARTWGAAVDGVGPDVDLKHFLRDLDVPYVVAEEEPNTGQPISQKIADLMRSCSTGIFIIIAIISRIVSGAAQAWFDRVLSGSTPERSVLHVGQLSVSQTPNVRYAPRPSRSAKKRRPPWGSVV